MKTVTVGAVPDQSQAAAAPTRLLDQVRTCVRMLHYLIRTRQAYVHWIKRHIRFLDKCHPREPSKEHVERFSSHLAVKRNATTSTQNQAKSALLSLHKDVLQMESPWLDGLTQARVLRRLPLVVTRIEVERVLSRLPAGAHHLVGRLRHGSGLRLMEVLRLRVEDVKSSRGKVLVGQRKEIPPTWTPP